MSIKKIIVWGCVPYGSEFKQGLKLTHMTHRPSSARQLAGARSPHGIVWVMTHMTHARCQAE